MKSADPSNDENDTQEEMTDSCVIPYHMREGIQKGFISIVTVSNTSMQL